MIIIRLKYLAVCLLVLLSMVSTMGGSTDKYKYYNSQLNASLCLSFKNNRLTDCCKQDDMQRIFVHKTQASTGIYHVKNFKKVLCYDKDNLKFRLYRRKSLGLGLCHYRHRRKREKMHGRRHGRNAPKGCTLSERELNRLRDKGCELHEKAPGNGFFYISYGNNSHYLGIRKGRVQRHKEVDGTLREPKQLGQRFMVMSESKLQNILSRNNLCRA